MENNLNYIKIPNSVFPTIRPIIPDDRVDAALIICMSFSKYFENNSFSYIEVILGYL